MKSKKPSVFPLYINGQYAQTNALKPVNDPTGRTGGKELCFVGKDDAELVEATLEGVRMTFEQIQKGGFFPLAERLEFLERFQTKIEEQAENLANLIVMEVGKPLKQARTEVARCLTTIEWTRIEAAHFFDQKGLPVNANAGWAGLMGSRRREGKGPLLAITPFNFPLNLALHKIAPAIAAGCPVIFKPSNKSALCALTLVDLAHAAGLPPGMMSLLNLENDDTVKLIKDSRVRLVSFTGSAKVGFDLQALAPTKEFFLELGGTGPSYIGPDADLEVAAEKSLMAGFGYAGQVCIALQNIHIDRKVYDPFVKIFSEKISKITWGDPGLEEVVSGPVIDTDAAKRLQGRYDTAVQAGAKVLAQAESQPIFAEGIEINARYLKPWLLSVDGVSTEQVQTELFGPGVFAFKEEGFESFIEKANHYPARFQVSLFTKQSAQVQRAFDVLDYGAVLINESNSLRIDPMPFGGNAMAGNTREGPFEALTSFTQSKTMLWRP